MGRKKKEPPAPPPPARDYVTGIAISIRGTTRWRDWLRARASRKGSRDVNAYLDRLIREDVARDGEAAPPSRLEYSRLNLPAE